MSWHLFLDHPLFGKAGCFKSLRFARAQLLGLKGKESYLESQILAAYEDLASTQEEEGYSSRAQDGKLRMLDQAADAINESTITRESEVQVQWDDLPGALALLQEVCFWQFQ